MLFGITYDLREDYLKAGFTEEETAEFDCLGTIQAIEAVLKGLGHETDRIGGIKALVRRLAQGERWDMVFNISEGVWGIGREAQVPAILDAYGIPYTFSDPLVLALSLHKGMAKRVIRDLKIPTPKFIVIDSVKNIELNDMAFPLFVKPVAEGTSRGIDNTSKVHDRTELDKVCFRLFHKYRQPVLIEEYLPGREFTVGILGTGTNARAIGVMEIIIKAPGEAAGYTYRNKKHYMESVEYRPAKDRASELCCETALEVWRGLGCRDGGRVDLKLDSNGIPNFIEINPLAGLNPDYSDLPLLSGMFGISYKELITSIVESSLSNANTSQRNSMVSIHK